MSESPFCGYCACVFMCACAIPFTLCTRLTRLLCYLWFGKMSETSIKIIKNEVGCRDDTMSKTEKVLQRGLIACNNLPQPPPYILVVEDCCMLSLLLAVPSYFNSFWHGVIPTSYFIFNDFSTCNYRPTED